MPWDLIVKLALGLAAIGTIWGAFAWLLGRSRKDGKIEQRSESLEELAKLQQKGEGASAKPITGKVAALLRRLRRNRGL